MYNRRRRVSRCTEDEINELILKLLPNSTSASSSNNNIRVSASKVLKETCKYIKKLQKEVDDLSERLSQLVASGDITATDLDIISTLLKL